MVVMSQMWHWELWGFSTAVLKYYSMGLRLLRFFFFFLFFKYTYTVNQIQQGWCLNLFLVT